MPDQQQKVLEFYQKNPSAAASLRGSLNEEKIINLIKEKSKKTNKIISTKEAEHLIEEHHKSHNHPEDQNAPPKTSTKTPKLEKKKKKIRKK
jgi:trigger factor